MIHWAFLILAFVVGWVLSWCAFYWLIKRLMRVEDAIESAAGVATPW